MGVDNISLLLEQITEIVDIKDQHKLQNLITSLHEADAAELIQLLSPSYRKEMMQIIGAKLDPKILTYMDEPVRESIIDLWAQHEIAAALSKVDEQDALELLSEFTHEERRSLLRTLKPELRIALEESLSYPDDSAGRLMQHEFIALPTNMLAIQAAGFLHSAKEQSIATNIIFLVNEHRKPVASLTFAALILAEPNQTLLEISEPIICQAFLSNSHEDVSLLFQKYFINTIPVVDSHNKLVGILQLNNIIDVIHEQAQESLLQSAGVTESDFFETILSTINARLKWIAIAGIHSFVGAHIYILFQHVIEKNTILPALVQILLALSGTAGLQATTVTIRALVGRDLIAANTSRAIRKEAIIGLINGLLASLLLSGILFFYMYNHAKLFSIVSVFGFSVFLGMLISTIAGSVIPIVLKRLNVDPSVSASPLIASISDTTGLLIILTLAKNFLY